MLLFNPYKLQLAKNCSFLLATFVLLRVEALTPGVHLQHSISHNLVIHPSPYHAYTVET